MGGRGISAHWWLGLANPAPHTPHALLCCVRIHRCGFRITELANPIGRRHHEYTHSVLGRFTYVLRAVDAVRQHYVDQVAGKISQQAIAAARAAAAATA